MVHCSAAVALDHGLLMGEVPDAGAPVLQVHVAQPAPAGRRGSRSPRSAARRPSASMLAVSASSVASAPSSRIDQRVAEIDAARRERREHVQRLVDRPRPAARRAASRPTSRPRAARRTCRRRDRRSRVSRCGRSRSPCSATSSSRLPNSTPCSRQFGVELRVDRAGCRASIVRPRQFHALGQAAPAAAALRPAARAGRPKRSSRNSRMIGPPPFFLLRVGQRQFAGTAPRPRGAARVSHAGSRARSRNASKASWVNPVWSRCGHGGHRVRLERPGIEA